MAWLGEDPLAYLRGRIDEVDDELAVLLARRVALTAAVQDHKEVGGHAGRDPEREAEIVERMAAHVPGLGPAPDRRGDAHRDRREPRRLGGALAAGSRAAAEPGARSTWWSGRPVSLSGAGEMLTYAGDLPQHHQASAWASLPCPPRSSGKG